jgi:hypothetical protein
MIIIKKMERTEIQNRIEEALMLLPDNHPRIVIVQMVAAYNNERGYKTATKRVGNTVRITLVEPDMPNDLAEWGEAVAKAEEYLELILPDMHFEFTHPNFFKALQSKLDYRGLSTISYQ